MLFLLNTYKDNFFDIQKGCKNNWDCKNNFLDRYMGMMDSDKGISVLLLWMKMVLQSYYNDDILVQKFHYHYVARSLNLVVQEDLLV